MKYLNWRQRRSLAAYRRRLADFEETQQLPPDGRDDELRARGAVLDWQRRVKANEARRARRKFWQGVLESRARFAGESNVVSIWEARR